ncbi:MAG: succinate dehydrogenase, hydrophobic membrane anchor protein [Burkholderiales bacterium]|nr:succinate dehydrogenase, hydrophobic membrane anchor protein [Burkholderiales bacterium]
MVKRTVVGAHYGLAGWLAQRVTALVMAVYTLVIAAVLLAQPARDHAAWKALFAQGWMRLATMLFLASLLLHAWVGMRDILMDYVKSAGLRFALQVLVILALGAYAGWMADILWRT